MKLMGYVKELRRRRARKRYEREKAAARALQDEGSVDRVAENAKRYIGSGPGAT